MRLLLLFMMGIARAIPPSTYDLKALYPQCKAFQNIFQQGTCSSCCAAAIATELSLRECILHNKPERMYSAQQIWDCAGPSGDGTCRSGVDLGKMINAMGTGLKSSRTLVDLPCVPTAILNGKEPNSTQCDLTANFTACGHHELGGASQYNMASYYATLEYSSLMASRAMMNEIIENGPVVSVIMFSTASDFGNFVNMQSGGHIFMPNSSLLPSTTILHCLVVYGWGTDDATGRKYWLVQNSYGATWADGGFGRVLQGVDLLEGTWKGLFPQMTPTTPVASNAKNNNNNNNNNLDNTNNNNNNVIRIPDNDIIVLTFISAIFMACLLVCFLSSRHHQQLVF